MARTLTRFAELAPDPPRDHADFEVFIRELDAGRVSPVPAGERNDSARSIGSSKSGGPSMGRRPDAKKAIQAVSITGERSFFA